MHNFKIGFSEMKHTRRGYSKCSPMYEVDLKKSDSYGAVVCKVRDAIGIPDDDDLCLFTARGAVIVDNEIKIGDVRVKWTLGAFLSKHHTAPDKINLGIGLFFDDHDQQQHVTEVSDKRRNDSNECRYFFLIWLSIIIIVLL